MQRHAAADGRRVRPADRLAARRRRRSIATPPIGWACRSGLIDQTLYDAFGQEQVATIYTDTSQHKVILEVEPQFQDDPSALSHIYVAGADRRAGAAVRGRAYHATRSSR